MLYDSHSGAQETAKFILPPQEADRGAGVPLIMASDEGVSDPRVSDLLHSQSPQKNFQIFRRKSGCPVHDKKRLELAPTPKLTFNEM